MIQIGMKNKSLNVSTVRSAARRTKPSPTQRKSLSATSVLRTGLAIFLLIASFTTQAEAAIVSYTGKILQAEGHAASGCARIVLRETSTNIERVFRIAADTGGAQNQDVLAVALSALVSGKTASISYFDDQPPQCGSERLIAYITIYAD